MRQSAKIALIVALMGTVACAQAAGVPGSEGELNEYDDVDDDAGSDDEEETGDGDEEETGDGDGDSRATGDGDEEDTGDGDSEETEEDADAGMPAPSDPLGGLSGLLNQFLGIFTGGGSGGADAGP
jgi:hypothetical protein